MWPDGRVYIGDWVDNKMHGYGKLTCPDGRVYDGEFVDNGYINIIPFKCE